MSRPTNAGQLREAFLGFFEERGHLRMPAASLIPANDPTLLLTNSGMAQFKQYFSGELEPPRARITTSQKSFRTSDIESVGDATHLTLFEMLGNFSFGDYFKQEACAWALEFMTKTLQIDPERLYMTVYQDDDEAAAIWRGLGVPQDRIYRFGAKDNFWGPAGNEGPCGPCSELHYYRGDLKKVPRKDDPVRKTSWGPNLHPEFVELYNLVFTQFYHHADGSRTSLPKKNIDTGMGLERTLVVLQGVKSVYESDLFKPIIRKAMELSGKEWGIDRDTTRALSVVAEHGRSASFLIGDGVIPGNTGRGYVLRRLIRRGMLFGRQLGLTGSFLPQMSAVAAEVMGEAYPELVRNGPFIRRVLELEEERFARTLDQGNQVMWGMFNHRRESGSGLPAPATADRPETNPMRVGRQAAEETRQSGARHDQWQKTISGKEAFLLYDTYGFPVEITREVAEGRGLTVDLAGFEAEMTAQRERGRAAGQKFGGDAAQRRVYEDLGADDTPFLGYHATSADSVVIGIIRDGEPVQSASTGDKVEIVLRETPFYAEKGGQVGDTGSITGAGFRVDVTDTHNPYAHLASHIGLVREGEVRPGDSVRAEVDVARRERIRRNHTATHLLHAALREVIGQHVRQGGSLVAPDRLRFDFTHMAPLTDAELKAVQDLVNEQIRANTEVNTEHTTYAAAIQKGALAFFGDKYENNVRAVCIVGVHGHDGSGHSHAGSGQHKHECWSYELCGGTHMDRTGGIGACVIVSETGIGAGMRRLEALTGAGAEELIWQRSVVLNRLSASLRTPVAELEARTGALQADLDSARKKIAELEDKLLRASLTTADPASEPHAITVPVGTSEATVYIYADVPAPDQEALRRAGDHLRATKGSGILVLGAVIGDQPRVIVMATKDLQGTEVHAGKIAGELSALMGGRGGGTAEVGQGGGRDPSRLPSVLNGEAVRSAIEKSAGRLNKKQ